jgi:ribonuclease-3
MRTNLTDSELNDAEAIIGHSFTDRDLLRRALTHSSAGSLNNDTLATLGDFIHVGWLARRVFDIHRSKGWLTVIINACRSGATQDTHLRDLGLDRYLIMGPAMLTNGATVTESMAATMFEAIVAAIEIDDSRAAAEAFLERVAGPAVDRAVSPTQPVETPSDGNAGGVG